MIEMIECLPEAGYRRSIDLGFTKTVGQRGRHTQISNKARTVVRVNQTRMMQRRAKREKYMVKKGYTAEQIINKLREAEIILSKGPTIAAASKKIGVSDYTYYRWRKEYGGMRVGQVPLA